MTKNNSTLDIKIPNDSIIQDFKKHLELDFNQRILFTAPFGAGKSTFIDDFKAANEQEYRFVRLYPVNYAVASNEDIFELVKFDILYELMAHHQEEISLQKEDFTFWLRMSMFMKSKSTLMPLFLHIISLHESIGKPVAKFIEVAESTVKNFKQFSEEIKVDELEDISKFLGAFKKQKGSSFEMDATSQFIYDLINRLKGKELVDEGRENKTILVIDDLDRLDPDHIFRLFNIFSAHTHSITGDNKFGFDKVIFVCDIDNIRKIYYHKYGKGVDFSGYMDKFYSIKPFEFDHKEYLSNQLKEIIKEFKLENTDLEFIKGERFKEALVGTLKLLIGERIINLRSLLQVRHSVIDLSSHKESNYERTVIPGILIFKILKEIFGGISALEDKLLSIVLSDQRFEILPENTSYYKYRYSLNNYEYQALLDTFIVFQDEALLSNKERNSYGLRERKKFYLENIDITLFYFHLNFNYVRTLEGCELYKGNIDIDSESKKSVVIEMPYLLIKAFQFLKLKKEL